MATVIALGALLALILMLTLPPTPLGFIAAAPLTLAFIFGLVRLPRWPLVTALLLLLYFSYGVMDILTNPAGRSRAIFFTVLTILGFFAAIDRYRRR